MLTVRKAGFLGVSVFQTVVLDVGSDRLVGLMTSSIALRELKLLSA